jgi:pyruvate dehydrogenase E1 component beta subunit
MVGGKIKLPMVVRLPLGAGTRAAAQHSQSLEAWLAHIPGLKVVYPSSPNDAYGLMLKAIEDDNPVIFLEHKLLYGIKGDVDENSKPIEFGKADVKREGKDLTVVATGKMVYEALNAAEELAKEGIEVEVIDPRTLFPFDKETLFNSIEKTNKLIIVTEENKRGSFAGEISAIVAEECFDNLDAPIIRVCSVNSPVPFSPVLEDYYVPNAGDIVKAAKKMF